MQRFPPTTCGNDEWEKFLEELIFMIRNLKADLKFNCPDILPEGENA